MGNIISMPRWDIPYIPSQDGILASHPRMGHPIQRKNEEGTGLTTAKKEKKMHSKCQPILGWDIPSSHPIPGWAILFPCQDGISHTSHPRMGLLHPIPGWDIPYIPSQDGIIASHPRMGYISHIPHPRKGFLHPIPGRDIPSHDPRKG
jgi:hypothetical protein